MPSYSEARRIAYVEAAAAGLPSIGTMAGGSDYLIGDGGLVVDPRDDDALLDAMRRLADPAVAARKGAAARRRSERFTWEAVAGACFGRWTARRPSRSRRTVRSRPSRLLPQGSATAASRRERRA